MFWRKKQKPIENAPMRDYSNQFPAPNVNGMNTNRPILPAPPNPSTDLQAHSFARDWAALGEKAWDVLERRRIRDLFPNDAKSEFERYMDVLERSSPKYRQEVFIGLEPDTNRPLFVPRKVFNHHAYILGATGSGKTTQALAQLLIQLAWEHDDTDDRHLPPPPMLIIDLKQNGDRFLRALAENIAQVRGQKLRFFSIDSEYESLHFDPLHCLRTIKDPIKLLETLMKAFGLIYPEGYGSDFFTAQQRTQLMEILLADRPTTLSDLIEYMRTATRPKGGNTDARGLYSAMAVIGKAAHIHADGSPIDNDKLIDFERFFDQREIVYAHLDSRSMNLLSRDVGRLLLFSLLETASQREKHKEKTQAFVAIDEFHRLAARNVIEMLEDARSAGVGFLLAHQSSSSLKTRDADFYGILFENCSFKQCLTLEDPRVIELFQTIAGRIVEIRHGDSTTETKGVAESKGWTDSLNSSRSVSRNTQGSTTGNTWGFASAETGGTSKSRSSGRTESRREEMVSALTPELITEVNDVPLLSLVHVKGVGKQGLTPTRGIPIRVQGLFPVTRRVAEEMMRTPWPLKSVDAEAYYRKFVPAPPNEKRRPAKLPQESKGTQGDADEDATSTTQVNQGEYRALAKRIDTLADKLAGQMLGQPMTAGRFCRRFETSMRTLKGVAAVQGITIDNDKTELTAEQVSILRSVLGKGDSAAEKDNGP